MGNGSSKTQSARSSPSKPIEIKCKNIERGVAIATTDDDLYTLPLDVLSDPRSPHIARTPLAKVVSHRLIEKPLRIELNAHTPTNILRKRILRDIGLNYTPKEINLLDPRSPSLFIPRTPLQLSSDDGFGGEHSRGTSKIISLEYSGFIEEASCRNFNEKLANITLDDTDYEDASDSLAKDDEFREGELAEIRRKYLETNFDFVGDEIKFLHEQDPRSPSENICRTPFVLPLNAKSLSQSNVSGIDNVSPIVTGTTNDDDGNDDGHENRIIEKYALQMFSSTPTVHLKVGNGGVVKTKNLEKMMKTRIYEDEPEEADNTVASAKSIEILMTPLKKFGRTNANDDKPRTPLSIVNRRTKSAESLAQRQSRLRVGDKENAKNTRLNAIVDENIGIEKQTPRRPAPNMNKNQLSVRSSCSKIPIFKK